MLLRQFICARLATQTALVLASVVAAVVSYAAPTPSQNTVEHKQFLQQLNQNIESVISAQGPYAVELGQLYASLGSQLQKSDEHVKALQMFKSAMHVERINQGLYSPSQEHILDAMVNSALALKDWQLATDFLKHWQWLATEHGSNGPDAYLKGVRHVAKLHLNAFFGGNSLTTSQAETHILKADYWFSSAVNAIQNHHGEESPSMIPWLHDVTTTAYYLSLMSLEKNRAIEDSVKPKEDNVIDSTSKQTAFILAQYRKGKDAIESMINIHKSGGEQNIHARFEAEVLLADWYQLFGRPESARRQYSNAYQLLFANLNYHNPEQDLVRMPVGLPEKEDLTDTDLNTDQPALVVSYDVSWRGNASNFQLLQNPGASKEEINALKLRILGQKYRPKLVNGVATDAHSVTQSYPFDRSL